MTDIVERLREQVKDDHVKGCSRYYYCDCGYDLKTEGLLEMAADEIETLRTALHWIADICPATAEHTLAHEMADAAIAALRKAP